MYPRKREMMKYEARRGETVTESTSEDRARFRLARFDSQIRIEYELIGHRMSWLMVSQSFLFAAFATAAHSIASQTSNGSGVVPLAQRILLPTCILWLVPILGAAAAICAPAAIFAAKSVILELKTKRDELEEEASRAYKYDIVGVPRSAIEHKLGNLTSLALPPLFFSAWLLLLVKWVEYGEFFKPTKRYHGRHGIRDDSI
jgi:hypothetical protein